LKVEDAIGFGMGSESVLHRFLNFFQGIVIPIYKVLDANKEDSQ